MDLLQSWQWLKDNQSQISATSSIVTALSFVVTATGVVLTYLQLLHAKGTLQVTTVYNIQKQGGELFADIAKDKDVYAYIFGSANQPDFDRMYRASEPHIARVIQYYSLVYNQYRIGAIPKRFWKGFSEEMKAFFRNRLTATFWQIHGVKGRYNKDFVRFWRRSTPKEYRKALR